MNKKLIFLIITLIFMIIIFMGITYGKEGAEYNYNEFSEDSININGDEDYSQNYYDENKYKTMTLRGKVVEAGEPYDETDEYSDSAITYQDVKVRIIDKELYTNTVLSVKYDLTYYLNNNMKADKINVNDNVYVYLNIEDGVIQSSYIQYIDKQNLLIWMIAIYSVGILIIGGFKGLKALISLVITILIIFCVTIPCIYKGIDPLTITLITSIAVTILTFGIVAGFTKKTICAIIGTSCGIIIAGIFAIVFGNWMKLSGIGEEALMLSSAPDGTIFNFKGILFSGIIIGALGACMDVGMSIASAISELKNENPKMMTKELMRAGMNIGKDIMGTMTNTLILAYVGGALTIILIFMGFKFEFFEVINQEMIAEEILRAIAGSFGLVFTIPLTTLISSILMGRKNNEGEYNG